jgi:hypothetical protein
VAIRERPIGINAIDISIQRSRKQDRGIDRSVQTKNGKIGKAKIWRRGLKFANCRSMSYSGKAIPLSRVPTHRWSRAAEIH